MHNASLHRPAGHWPEEKAVGTLSLDFDARHRRRIRLTTDHGEDVLLDLPKTVAESAHRLFLWPVSGGAVKGSVVHRCSSSIQEIALRQGQHFRGFTGEQTAVGTYFVRLGIDFHAWRGVIEHHRALADLTGVGDGEELLREAQ